MSNLIASEEKNESTERFQKNGYFLGKKTENDIESRRYALNSPQDSRASTPGKLKTRTTLLSNSSTPQNQTPTRASSIQSGLNDIQDLLGSISKESIEDYADTLASDSNFIVRDQQIKKQQEAQELENMDKKLKELSIQRDVRVQGYLIEIEKQQLEQDVKRIEDERLKREHVLNKERQQRDTLKKIFTEQQEELDFMEKEIYRIRLEISQYEKLKNENFKRKTELAEKKLEEERRLEELKKETELVAEQQKQESIKREEEQKIQQAKVVAQAKKLAEEKAKKLAEERAKKEAEEKAKKEAEEIAKKEQLEKKNKVTTNSDIAKEYLKYKNMIEKIKIEINEPVNKNSTYKLQCQQLKRHIRPKLGQLNDSRGKLITIYREILDAIQGCRNVPLVFSWVLNYYSKALIDQAEAEVSASINRALPLAILTASLLGHLPELYDYLVARFVKKCPMIIGFSCGIDTVEGITRMGYRRSSDGTFETQEKVADRVSGIVALWSALTIAQPLDQGCVSPISAADGWKMLARLANTPKDLLINLHFTVASTWWDVGSEQLRNQYGKQGIKLLQLLSRPWPASVSDKKYPAALKLMIQGEEWQKTGQLKSLKPLK